MGKVEIICEAPVSLPYLEVTENLILDTAEKVLAKIEQESVHINVILQNNAAIQDINKTYRHKDSPTDVISFAYRDGEEAFPTPGNIEEELGDVYISLELAEEQAVEYGVTVPAEVKRLLVHGILHLVGYDHEGSEANAKEMEGLEEKILSTL